jgi:hypothetical protein
MNIPIKIIKGDNALVYNFKNHKTGAGHRSRRKKRMLSSAVKKPRTIDSNWIIIITPECESCLAGHQSNNLAITKRFISF